ncbi:MAG: phosphoribosylglycinamide formyltransferase [Thermaerobacter sp.]|nr:phosphoribosylglycinamide formyltransferase [Thermaerobacter sp.]
MKWAVLVGGRGSNLAALLDAGLDVGLVVSHRAEVGALDIAARAGVPARVLLPRAGRGPLAYDRELASWLGEAHIDAVVAAGYLRILRAPVIDRYPGRILNVHPSLLPAFAGLHAIEQTLAHGVKVTGVTVHLVDAGLDSGPIVAQQAVAVAPDDTPATLSARLQVVEHRLLPAAAWALDQGRLRVNGRHVIWTEPETHARFDEGR